MAVNSIQNTGIQEATQPSIMKKQNDIMQEFVLICMPALKKRNPVI